MLAVDLPTTGHSKQLASSGPRCQHQKSVGIFPMKNDQTLGVCIQAIFRYQPQIPHQVGYIYDSYMYMYMYIYVYIYILYIYIIYMCIPSYIPMNVSWNPNVYRLNSIFRYSQISGRLSPMPGSSSRPWSTGWDGAWCISSSGCRWRAPTARVWTTLGDCVTGAASHKSQGERRIPSGNLT